LQSVYQNYCVASTDWTLHLQNLINTPQIVRGEPHYFFRGFGKFVIDNSRFFVGVICSLPIAFACLEF